MKKTIFPILFFLSTIVNAQKVDFGLSLGTGKTYIIESATKGINVNYGIPISFLTEVKYTPKAKKWGIKLRVQSIESVLKGENWMTKATLNGYINALTTSLLLENEIAKNSYSYGFNFGFGLTKETLQPLRSLPNNKEVNSYTSLNLGYHFTKKLSKELDFQIQPVLIWQDPLKSLSYLTRNSGATLAGEDVSFLVNFGLRYRFSQ